MRTLAVITLFAVTALGRAGPDTATKVRVVEPACKVAVRMEPRACPPFALCDLTIELPSPGYDLSKPAVQVDRANQRIRIELRATPKPGDGIWPAVMTPARTTATIGHLNQGRYVAEIHYAVGENSPLRPHRVFLLDALR